MMTNVHHIRPIDQNRSTVAEEIDSMDWDVTSLFALLSDLEKNTSESSRECLANNARRRLNRIVQRAFRAKQIAAGLRVPKAN